ncbi:3'-5' exonuclease [Pseudomonas sp. 5P_3.1_Bac2]|uniref:3'-5' exonuclease n=1 Tax=Pseudomonas sp. 5P_3.1_Bac2 TaxID=2971617 RepID=UPI0021C9C314|nr:3'-5' exonuclease [Pseudomonas sp. 5P_3.1_Bac2]MCU1719176.1 3'-5' exonuclease [Pseudomonas sp. 5P_3.1_Bac2]
MIRLGPAPPPLLDWPQRMQTLAESAQHPSLKAFYQVGTCALDTPLEHVPLLALDVETTGLDAQQHAIVSLGLLPFTLQRIRCAEAAYWLVKPEGELHDASVTFHHITHSDIRHAPRMQQILDQLLKAMAGRVMVVHYRHIERNFLEQAARQCLGEGWQFPLIDTMQLEAQLHPTRYSSWWHRLRGRPPLSLRLADSRGRYHLPSYQAHHALTDALACAELLQAQVSTHFGPHTPVSQLWS